MASLTEILARPGSADRMRQIENEITKTVLPFKGNTEAMIVVFALIRVAGTLLDLYKPNTRKVIVEEVLTPKLHGEHKEEGLLFQ